MTSTFLGSIFRCVFVTALVLATGSVHADEPPPLRDFKDTCDAESQTMVEVAKLFQRGESRVDLDAMKRLMMAVVERYDRDQPYDNQENAYYDRLRDFFRYLDAHRLDVSDIEAVRVWLASSRAIRVNEQERREEILAYRVEMAFRDVWKLAQDQRNKCIECEPRHALVCLIMTDRQGTFGDLTRLVRLLEADPPKIRLGPHRDEQIASPIGSFLLREANRGLLAAAREDVATGHRTCTGNEPFEVGEIVQRMLDDRDDPDKVRQHFDAFVPQYEVTLKVYPAHYLGYKFDEIGSLRSTWNIIHAYGDDATKAAMKAFVESLRDYHAERGETLAATWLSQVMEPPDKPMDRFLYQVILTPVNKPEETKN